MSDLNNITVIGRVGSEPERKAFESGAIITKFSLANNQYDGKKKEDVTHWFRVETFSKLTDYIKRGKFLAIEGKLKAEQWQDDEGTKRTRTYIFAENIQILTPKEKDTAETVTEAEEPIEEYNTDKEVPF